jgi:hypothetical protein
MKKSTIYLLLFLLVICKKRFLYTKLIGYYQERWFQKKIFG